jgi:hypothetical protein
MFVYLQPLEDYAAASFIFWAIVNVNQIRSVMSKIIALLLALTLAYFPIGSLSKIHERIMAKARPVLVSRLVPVSSVGQNDGLESIDSLKAMLLTQAPGLSEAVVNKVVTSLKCIRAYNVEHKHILTIIDYSIPSSEKRLWVLDLKEKKLLFHTYVSHGIKSGTLLTNFFSNKNNSKASSLGVYTTSQAYYGREGLSLRLDGLDANFNDNASSRSIVMHGGWYVEEEFIKKYGRPGRSWGCPALPLDVYQPIIQTIKDKSVFVVYYPNDRWFEKSKFLNCERVAKKAPLLHHEGDAQRTDNATQAREEVLFVDLNKNYQSAERRAIVTMSADDYARIFRNKPPLERMLRRQINNREFVALSTSEFSSLAGAPNTQLEALNAISFVTPILKEIRGYYETQMLIVPLGRVKEVRLNSQSMPAAGQTKWYTVYLDNQHVLSLKSTDQFIRWLGL